MNFDRFGTSESFQDEKIDRSNDALHERPFQLLFNDQRISRDLGRKIANSMDKENKAGLSSPGFDKIPPKAERPSNIFSNNFTRPRLEILSLNELQPDENNTPMVTDRSQLIAENQSFRPKSILKFPKFSLRNEAEMDEALETHHQLRDKFTQEIPANIMQQNPSIPNLGRESLKMADSIVMNAQYLYSHHAFMKQICGLHVLQIALILIAAICCYVIQGYRKFLNDFPYFFVITGASALLVFLLLIVVHKISSKSPFNVILYVIYCLLLAVSLSVIGLIDEKNIGLIFASGMALTVSVFIGGYAAFKQSPMSFVGGMWVGLFSVFLVFGYSLLLMETNSRPLIFWVSLAGAGYGVYLAYDLRQISCSKRTIWSPEKFPSAAICLHFDWILIIWDMSKFIAVTYNNSRISLRRSRSSVNFN